MSRMSEIVDKYGAEYVLRQLAEECAELAHSALKLIRVWHNETPMREDEAREHLIEELADVHLMAHAVCTELLSDVEVQVLDAVCDIKEERMYHRLLDGKMESDVW